MESIEKYNMSTTVTIKKGEARSYKAGSLWIFDNEIESISGHFKNGDIVNVCDFDGFKLGKGYINQNSKIRIRMLSRNPETEINDDFFRMRVRNAWDYRKTVMSSGENDLNCCRVIFGEADFLPGITVDKYADILVVESLTLGMEPFKKRIVQLLMEEMEKDGFHIRGVFERSDAKERIKEGLERVKGFMVGEFDPHIEIVENDVHYIVDVENGQKTGFFLDQKYNRRAIKCLCRDKKVLDCFTHMGTFALNAGIAGAKEVTGLDISEFAVDQATKNAELNGLADTVKFEAANVLDALPELYKAGERYDVVILDPPAFTKSKEATKNAIKGYREVNMKGMKLVKDGGYLATCSCSHFMTEDLFKKTIAEAARSVHKRLRQIEFRTQSPDHPILWSNDSSYYLKFLIFQVCEEK